jgi:uncharacterized membrane protein YeaQ/YmgE (transglycosylase-associated protein family)
VSDRLGAVDGTQRKGARVRRRLDTWQIVALCVLGVVGAGVAVDMVRAVGGILGGLLWFLLFCGAGVFCGWLAERIMDDDG